MKAVRENRETKGLDSGDTDSGPEVDTIEAMNKNQESVFNEINNDLVAQLVSLGGMQQVPQSLGSIISRQV
ncbi:hypothetical protein AB835_04395 [Candidatus Endobugula sertula]|uniref:Uncharacterized protein n=1 Tax=Candidatus Endobugula sertula TaxID=62101 RepID=A0A1D2QRS2_9GAMM|nr:hypothetical protein AB835_04395 [Candidatus Endobugula sertula]